jgi:hypothetical protein
MMRRKVKNEGMTFNKEATGGTTTAARSSVENLVHEKEVVETTAVFSFSPKIPDLKVGALSNHEVFNCTFSGLNGNQVNYTQGDQCKRKAV